ncbi:MAG TPA: YdeI/OmpD-associated family protein [Gemmatimonadales bacterium]
MSKKDPRVDAYIAAAAPFARPILNRLRKVVHSACPGAEETLKWRTPTFMYHGILCGMAAFKSHCMLGFWKSALLETKGLDCLTSVADLPSDRALAALVKQAAALNEEGIKAPRRTARPRPPLKVPADVTAALKKNAKARATFAGFSPSHKREYVEWVTEAKTDETRQRRLETAVAWMAQGKPRNWEYVAK